MTREEHEVVIIGGGIAGASLAYFLSEQGVTDVVILEQEEVPAYHTTGRSAAVLYELDPNPTVQRLKALGGQWLRDPPVGFSEHPVLKLTGALAVMQGEEWRELPRRVETLGQEGIRVEVWPFERCRNRVEVLSPDSVEGGAFLPLDGAIDVHELLSSYLRHAKSRGVEVRYVTEVTGVLREGQRCAGVRWRRSTDERHQGEIRARWVVDAAGAWAGRIAQLAGAAPIELTPMRRCAITYSAPNGVDVSGWPLVSAEHLRVYFEPETTGLLMSPMDETPMEPHDVQADEITIAEGVERLRELAPRIVPRVVHRRWAGLRTFSRDRVHVIGEDPTLPGFFWLAGQGGNGIETSGFLGQVAADLLVSGTTERFDAQLLGPGRFA